MDLVEQCCLMFKSANTRRQTPAESIWFQPRLEDAHSQRTVQLASLSPGERMNSALWPSHTAAGLYLVTNRQSLLLWRRILLTHSTYRAKNIPAEEEEEEKPRHVKHGGLRDNLQYINKKPIQLLAFFLCPNTKTYILFFNSGSVFMRLLERGWENLKKGKILENKRDIILLVGKTHYFLNLL